MGRGSTTEPPGRTGVSQCVTFAVIGLGDWGLAVAETLEKVAGAELQVLCDADPEVVRRLRGRWPGVAVTGSLDELLHDMPVDAVVVATPLRSRGAVARLALVAGRHVFVRAPPAARSQEIERLAMLAGRHRRTFVAGGHQLGHPALRRLLATTESGDLGNVSFVQAESQHCRRTASPDILLELGLAPLTAILALVREEPVTVSGHGHRAAGNEALDLVCCHLGFASGIAADVRISQIAHQEVRRLTIIGSERSARYDALDRTVTVYERPERGESPTAKTGDPDAGTELRVHFRDVGALACDLESFVAAIRGDREVVADARFVACSYRVIEVLRALIDARSSGASGDGSGDLGRTRSGHLASLPMRAGRVGRRSAVPWCRDFEAAESRTRAGQKPRKGLLIHMGEGERWGGSGVASAATTHAERAQRAGRSAVIVDGHPLWLEAVARVLARASVTVVGTGLTGAELLEVLAATTPDILVGELWPRGAAIEALGWVASARALVPDMKLLVLSSHEDQAHIDAAFAAGADVYVVKTAPRDDLEAALRQAFDQSVYIRPRADLGEAPSDAAPTLERASTKGAGSASGLTRREVEILRLVAMGHSNSELARMLWVTDQTIKFHLSNIYRKTATANRTAASRWALAHGLLEEPDSAEPAGLGDAVEAIR